MYSFETTVRYSECDSDRQLSLVSLVDYFQDCSSFHSEEAGVGIDYLASRGVAWFLLNWQIVIGRMPVFGEKIRVCTCPYGFKGFFGMRNFWIEDREGNILVKANSIWSYMDIIKGRPAKAPLEDMVKYNIGEPLEMDYAPRKLEIKKELTAGAVITVTPDMIDTNRHVNNGQYIRAALRMLKEERPEAQIRQMLAEYKKSAVLGDRMYSFSGWEAGRFYVELKDEQGGVYASIVLECR